MAQVAIIIPAYNAEKTVENTVRNVLAQNLQDIEVWITDDGSTDRTGEILDKLAEEDSRIRVIHQENSGAYQARLHALQRIKTPFFGFVDADDTIEPDMYEKMIRIMERDELDVLQCRIYGEKTNGELRILTGKELIGLKYGYLVNSVEACYIWDKLYRNQYNFGKFELTDKVTNYDDLIFNLQFFKQIKRFGLLDEGLYHYRDTDGSATRSYGPRQEHDYKWMVRNHYRLSCGLFPDGEYSKFHLWVGHIIWWARNLRSTIITQIRSKLNM